MKLTTVLLTIVTLITLLAASNVADALTLTRGVATPLTSIDGTLECRSVDDVVTITGGFVAPGTLDLSLNIPANRVQYDFHNTINYTADIVSWTLYYDASLGSQIIGAYTPIGYMDAAGYPAYIGGQSYTTLLNGGYGVYTYNTGAPWTIDYQTDHITFEVVTGVAALPHGTAVGVADVGSELPAFAVLFDPAIPVGYVDADAWPRSANVPMTGRVLGPIIPEPASILALVCGLGGLVWRRRR